VFVDVDRFILTVVSGLRQRGVSSSGIRSVVRGYLRRVVSRDNFVVLESEYSDGDGDGAKR
jgi:hypothetical protein